MNYKMLNVSKTLLASVNVVGTVGTVVLAVKATPKAIEAIKLAELDKGSKLTKKEKVKACWKCYIPAAIVGAGTIASSIGSYCISNKVQASLIAGAAALDQAYKKYGNKVKEALGIEKEKEIRKSLADEEKTKHTDNEEEYNYYYMDIVGFFKAKPEDIYKAMLIINKNINGANENQEFLYFQTIKDFLNLCNAKDYDENPLYDELGWTSDLLIDNTPTSRSWLYMNEPEECINDINHDVYYYITFASGSEPTRLNDDIKLSEDAEDRLINALEEKSNGDVDL